MKTIIFSLFMVLATAFPAHAEESPIAVVKGTNVVLINDAFFSNEVAVKLTDLNNKTLSRWKFGGQENKNKLLNLEELPYGMYMLTMEDTMKIIRLKISSSKKGTVVEKESLVTIAKPQIKFKGGVITYRHFAQGRLVNIMLKDAFGQLLYEEAIVNTDVIHRHYRLKQFLEGAYTLHIKMGQDNFYQRINR